nr:hypothetical protein [Paraurantiacibacter namhicola]
MGSNSVADQENTVSFGRAFSDNGTPGDPSDDVTAITRRLTNISDGIDDTDAVTVGQLNAALASAGNPFLDTVMGFDPSPASATGVGAVALGSGSEATAFNSVALGTGSVADADDTVSVGSASLRRRITNLDAGIDANDAVTVAQLNAAIAGVSGGGGTASPYLAANSTGTAASATGDDAIALGEAAKADTAGSVAIGARAWVRADEGTAIGTDSYVTGAGGTAIGFGAQALGIGAVAIGRNVAATNGSTVVIGDGASAGGFASTALGAGSNASGFKAVAIGNGAQATQGGNAAIGEDASATGTFATAMGQGSTASGNSSIAFGAQSTASGQNSVSIGVGSSSIGANATAIGQSAAASAPGATAIGQDATANFSNSTAVGSGAATTAANQVMLGSDGTSVVVADIDSSTAAQVGPVDVVTVDANGTLGRQSVATTSSVRQIAMGMLHIQAVTDQQFLALGNRVTAVEDRVNVLDAKVAGIEFRLDSMEKRNNAGIAASMAFGGTMIVPDSTVSFNLNAATYRGEQGYSASVVVRVTPRLYVSGGYAGSTAKDSDGGRVGVAFGF